MGGGFEVLELETFRDLNPTTTLSISISAATAAWRHIESILAGVLSPPPAPHIIPKRLQKKVG